MRKGLKLYIGLAATLGVVLALRYTFHPLHRVRNSLEAVRLFESETRRKWGASLLDLNRTGEVRACLRAQPVRSSKEQPISLTDTQKQDLFDVIDGFLIAYAKGSVKAILAFHSRAPYELNFVQLDKSPDIQADLSLESIEPGTTPAEKLEAYWMLFQRYKYRNDFWWSYVENSEKRGLRLPRDQRGLLTLQANLLTNYLRDVTINDDKYVPTRLTGLSTASIHLTAYEVTTNNLNLMRINMAVYPGPQTLTRSVFRYAESPEDIKRKYGACLYATASLAVTLNGKSAVVPLTVIFYWSPTFMAWLPHSLAWNTLGCLRLLF